MVGRHSRNSRMKVRASRFLRTIGLLLGIAVFTALLVDRCTVGVPTERRIAEFNGGDLAFEFTPEFPSPYQFLIGVPASSASPPPFRGLIELRDHSGVVASIPISSENVQFCHWLRDAPGATAYILTRNTPRQLDDILRRGTPYQVRVSFSEPLPAGCSLWFSSMRHVSIVFNRDI